MLKLLHIHKEYPSADETVVALKDISLQFRKNEFVSILGPSGCGKTTLLNIIGGLDQYTSGDLQIGGRSTKEYRARDWDEYRNHSIGFVFQSYNLIPHQSVLANVELALTLAGVSREERRRRAEDALRRVGLAGQMHKRPNQMSGGQMQRVAIARALVNDPEILLADEPTGALDTKTSIQVMELLKEVAKDRLVIMVTHNPELAEKYSTRIIRLQDGEVVGDTAPCAEEIVPVKDTKKKKKRMSFFTALSLSFNNLLTKKARTLLTSFAGSIGIIGIALIMALSNGIKVFISQMQEDTLSSYPITLRSEQQDLSGMLSSLMGKQPGTDHDLDKVYANTVMYEMMETMLNAETTTNNLKAFRDYLESADSDIKKNASAIQYGWGITPLVYVKDVAGNLVRVDAGEIFQSAMGDVSSSAMMSSYTDMITSSSGLVLWEELLPGKQQKDGSTPLISDLLYQQYDLLEGGHWPTAANEVVLVVNSRNEVSDLVLYALGLKDRTELSDLMASILAGEKYEGKQDSYTYEELLNQEFKLILPTDLYRKNAENNTWQDVSGDQTALDVVTDEKGLTLKICGIIRPKEGVTATSLTGSLGYTYLLSDYIMDGVLESDLAKEQMDPANENRDVLSGLPFTITKENELTAEEKKQALAEYLDNLAAEDKAALCVKILTTPTKTVLNAQVEEMMKMLYKDGTTELDREKMEKVIYENLGSQSDLVKKYVEKLTDEKLVELIRTAAVEMIGKQYVQLAEQALQQQFLQVTIAQVQASLTSLTLKIGYLATAYSQQTGLPADTFTSYLATRSEEELDALVLESATKQAQAALEEGSAYEAFCYAAVQALFAAPDTDFDELYEAFMPSTVSTSTLKDNYKKLGIVDKDNPTSITIYADTFDKKEAISEEIARYNQRMEEAGKEDDKITYTDYVKLFISSITILVDAVTYVLVAFVSISLLVSSIMIGIITYISVLERTKEIGVLRAVGASKGDVSRVFNAETLIIGFTAGAIGILVSVLLCFPINAIIAALSGITTIKAVLPPLGAGVLLGLSMFLTFIAGLLPSRIAAGKDPVVALRTE